MKRKRIDELFGVWAMQADRAQRLIDFARNIDLRLHLEASDESPRARQTESYEMVGSIAVIPIAGVMTKSGAGDSMTQTVSTAYTRKMVRDARVNAAASGVVLYIDSPGGSACGVDDLAREIAATAKVKPVVACIEDCGCSAAYYAASQATKIVANEAAFVGCIGTYLVVDDVSKMYEKQGIKTHVISAGAFKGMGVPGTELTPEQIAEFQREVDAVNALFLAAVQSGRGMAANVVAALADGRAHIAAEAKRLGLIDEIGSVDAAIAMASAMATTARNTTQTKGRKPMSASMNDEPKATPKAASCTLPDGSTSDMGRDECEAAGGTYDEPTDASESKADDAKATAAPRAKQKAKPATLAELKAAFPSASAEFREQCQEQQRTMEQAKDAYIDLLTSRNEALAAKAEAAEKAATANKPAAATAGKAVATVPVADDDADLSIDDAKIKAEWDADPALRREFGKIEFYKSYKAAQAAGRIQKSMVGARR